MDSVSVQAGDTRVVVAVPSRNMTYQNPQWPPPPPARRDPLAERPAQVAAAVVLLMLGAFGLWILIRVYNVQTLDRVAIYRETSGFRVCPAADLHDCRIRGGTVMGRDRVAVVALIHAQPSCDDQEARARETCGREHPIADYGNAEQLRAVATCSAQFGVITSDATTLSDPRDPHLEPKGFQMECREGIRNGEFQQDGY